MVEVSNVRSTTALLPNGRRTWTVVDHAGEPIDEVDVWLRYLRSVDSADNTIKAYAGGIALFLRWHHQRSASWRALDFEGLCAFASDLMDGTLRALQRPGTYRPQRPRSRTTCEATMAAVYSFLDYWRLEGEGPTDLRLYREGYSSKTVHTFLAHIAKRQPADVKRLQFRGPRSSRTRVIDFESDFQGLIDAAHTYRDKTMISAMYDGGLRIGQTLGVRHSDLDIARKRLWVRRRTDNANAAYSKQRIEFTVDMPPRFWEYYGLMLTEEQLLLGIDSDYLFVNIAPGQHFGRPMSYSNARKVIERVGERAGVALHPHMLRHTHGTSLAKEGWSSPMIAKRLGQSSPSSADRYVHLVEDDIRDRYEQSPLAAREA